MPGDRSRDPGEEVRDRPLEFLGREVAETARRVDPPEDQKPRGERLQFAEHRISGRRAPVESRVNNPFGGVVADDEGTTGKKPCLFDVGRGVGQVEPTGVALEPPQTGPDRDIVERRLLRMKDGDLEGAGEPGEARGCLGHRDVAGMEWSKAPRKEEPGRGPAIRGLAEAVFGIEVVCDPSLLASIEPRQGGMMAFVPVSAALLDGFTWDRTAVMLEQDLGLDILAESDQVEEEEGVNPLFPGAIVPGG